MSVGQVGVSDLQAFTFQRSGPANIRTDLQSVLQDLQQGTAASTPGSPSTVGSSAAAVTSSPAPAGTSLANDLQSFFNDLKQAGGAHQAHNHHGGPKASQTGGDATTPTATPGAANAQPTSQGDLLGSLVKALQAYSTPTPAASFSTLL